MSILKDIDKAEEVLLDLRQQIQNGKKYFIKDGEIIKIYQFGYIYNGNCVFYSNNGTRICTKELLTRKEAVKRLSEERNKR